MSIIYSDNEQLNFQGGIDFSNVNSNVPYLYHLKNFFYLRFIASHTDTSVVEKAQARAEMLIAERKMAFWERQQNFNQAQKLADTEEQKRQWAQS